MNVAGDPLVAVKGNEIDERRADSVGNHRHQRTPPQVAGQPDRGKNHNGPQYPQAQLHIHAFAKNRNIRNGADDDLHGRQNRKHGGKDPGRLPARSESQRKNPRAKRAHHQDARPQWRHLPGDLAEEMRHFLRPRPQDVRRLGDKDLRHRRPQQRAGQENKALRQAEVTDHGSGVKGGKDDGRQERPDVGQQRGNGGQNGKFPVSAQCLISPPQHR